MAAKPHACAIRFIMQDPLQGEMLRRLCARRGGQPVGCQAPFGQERERTERMRSKDRSRKGSHITHRARATTPDTSGLMAAPTQERAIGESGWRKARRYA